MINPGTYPAKVISHAISETRGGDPQAAVTFSFDANGPKTMTWYGSFKEGKAREITIKALLACGLKGNNPAGPRRHRAHENPLGQHARRRSQRHPARHGQSKAIGPRGRSDGGATRLRHYR
jgi:hypothetical protein